MNTTYPLEMSAGFPGLHADNGDYDCISRIGVTALDFGTAAMGKPANNTRVGKCKTDLLTLTFSADLVASNVVNGNINGTAIVAVTFGTDHATTMAHVATHIAAIAGVTSATVTAARVITVITDFAAIAGTSWAVTAGESQATITVAAVTTDKLFRGIVRHQHKVDGVFNANDIVPVVKKGRFWVRVSAAVAIDDTAYVDVDEDGKFTNVSTNNVATGGVFRTARSGAGTSTDSYKAILEINLP